MDTYTGTKEHLGSLKIKIDVTITHIRNLYLHDDKDIDFDGGNSFCRDIKSIFCEKL